MASAPEIRPHFDLLVSRPPDEVMTHLSARLGDDSPWVGNVRGRHVQLIVPPKQRHLWSPWLTFEAQDHDDGTLLSGQFAPHPSVWTGYVALAGSVIFTMLGLGFFGLSQMLAGEAPTMLWSLPIGGVVLVILYLLSLAGQGLTAQQMQGMRSFVKACFPEEEARWIE